MEVAFAGDLLTLGVDTLIFRQHRGPVVAAGALPAGHDVGGDLVSLLRLRFVEEILLQMDGWMDGSIQIQMYREIDVGE